MWNQTMQNMQTQGQNRQASKNTQWTPGATQTDADGGMNPWLMLLGGLMPLAMNYFGGGAKGVDAAPKIDDPLWGRIPNPEYEQQAQQSQWQDQQRQNQLQQMLMSGLGMWLLKSKFGGGNDAKK